MKNFMLEVVMNALQAAFWVAAGGRSFLPPTTLLPLFRPTSRDYSHTMCAPHLYFSTILHFYKRQCWIYILNPGSLWTGNKKRSFFGIQGLTPLWAEELKHFWSWSAWVGRSQPSRLHKVMVMMMVVLIMMVLIMLRVIMRTEKAPRLRKVSLQRHMESIWGVAKKQRL